MKYNSELYKSIDGNNFFVDALVESEQPDISADDLRHRRKPLTEEEQKETCPACGHTRGAHHNPDDRCVECDCGYYFYGKR